MTSNQDLQQRRDAAFARGLGNQLPVYIGFALCFAAPHIDKRISEKKEESEEKERQLSNNETNEQE